jgi:hypothetical protein
MMKKIDCNSGALPEQKKEFRKAALRARDQLSAEQRSQKSSLITGRLCMMSAV